MGSPSFLAHQRALSEGQGRSNCQTLFGMSAIPSDNYIRQMLDGAPTAAFDPLFIKAIETPEGADPLPAPRWANTDRAGWHRTPLLAQGPLHAVLNAQAFGWRNRVSPCVPRCQHRGAGTAACAAVAAGIHRAPGRRGEAGLR